jgi:hypothetical protein
MPQRNVFICHASRDHAYVDELVHYVAPVVKTQLSDLRLWEDSSLFAGEPWSERIQQEIENSVAAVVIVSDNLLNSTYAMEREMPNFLARAEAGAFEVFCLYVKPCLVDEYIFKVNVKDGQRNITLAKYTWLNPPHTPIDSIFHRRRRVDAMVTASRKLVACLKKIQRPHLQLVGEHD